MRITTHGTMFIHARSFPRPFHFDSHGNHKCSCLLVFPLPLCAPNPKHCRRGGLPAIVEKQIFSSIIVAHARQQYPNYVLAVFCRAGGFLLTLFQPSGAFSIVSFPSRTLTREDFLIPRTLHDFFGIMGVLHAVSLYPLGLSPNVGGSLNFSPMPDVLSSGLTS